MDKPLITAIIPTHKRPTLLKRAVCSYLNQSFSNFEILISDDASGPETDRVIRELMLKDKRIKVLRHPQNIGPIANFNAALMNVTTPYVSFLADNDFVSPFFYEELVPILKQYPECVFYGGGGMIMNENYSFKKFGCQGHSIPENGYYSPPEGFFAYLKSSFAIAFAGLIFKTTLIQELGGFDSKIRNGADEYLISQCAARYPIYLVSDRPFVFAHQHEGCLSLELDFPLFEHEANYLHEALLNVPFSLPEKMEVDLFFSKRMLKIFSNAYRHFILTADYAEARKYAAKLITLTGSSRWKFKRAQSRLYEFFPFTAPIFERLKNLEKKWRHSRRKATSLPQKEPDLPENVDDLKDYVIALEKKANQLLAVE